MKKILDNYLSVDQKGFELIAKRCNDWSKDEVEDPAEVFGEIIKAGGCLKGGAIAGWYLFGNMYNPEYGLSGAVWVTSKVVDLGKDMNGHLWAETSSGSRYLLLDEHSSESDD